MNQTIIDKISALDNNHLWVLFSKLSVCMTEGPDYKSDDISIQVLDELLKRFPNVISTIDWVDDFYSELEKDYND